MNTSLSFSSISEIHRALTNNEYPPRSLYDYIVEAYDKWKKGEAEKLAGSEADYHNLSVEFSKKNSDVYAATIAALGVETYPMSTDLLADLIKYSQEIGDSESCKAGLKQLNEIDRQYWTWRTFVFVIDYLKDSLSYSSSLDEYKKNAEEAIDYINDFKKYIPYEERAYVAEAELCLNRSDQQGALDTLLDGIKKVAIAPQCCMKLADLYLERGEYANVEKYARKGILAALQDQPTVSVGYLYYLLALAMDAKRIQNRQSGQVLGSNDVQDIVNAYQTADRLFVNEGRPAVAYRNTIQARLIIIEMEECISTSKSNPMQKENIVTEKTATPSLSELLMLSDILKNKKDS